MGFYKILGVLKHVGLTTEDIQRAFRKRSKECHPDVGGDPEESHKVATAYQVLSNEEARKEYDETGTVKDKPNANHLARQRLMEIAHQWLEKTNYAQITAENFIVWCHRTIDNAESQLDKAKNEEIKKIDKLERLLEELVYSDDGNSPAHSFFQEELAKQKRRISDIDLELTVVEIIRSIVDYYEYPETPENEFRETSSFIFNNFSVQL